MLYLVFAVISLHILSLPIFVSVSVSVNTDTDEGKIKIKLFFIPVFVKRINVKRLWSKLNENTDINKNADNDEKDSESKKIGAFKRFLIDCAVATAKMIRISDADLDLRLGTGDAAADAVAVGVLRIMYTQACAFFGYKGNSETLRPDYNAEILFFDFFGIFSLCFADIIFAVCGTVLLRIAALGKRRGYANVTG